MKKNNKKPWIILALCCGLAASSIGVSINSSGVFYTPVSESLHMMRGTFSMHMTIFSLVTAITSLFVPRLMEKFSYKMILTVSVFTAVVSTGLMALGNSAIVFYILGAIRGMSTAMFSIVPLTLVINGWFEKKHGLATSIVFGFSGLAGSICSPILSSCIETFGWQMGYIIKAIILLCLCLPAVLYPFHVDARDDGYLPYGYEEKKENDVSVESPTFHFITVAFISFFVFGLMCSCITSVTQHLPGFAESIGYSSVVGASLLSAGMVGNIISKLVIGTLSDHFGSIKATIVMIIANTLGIVMLMMGKSELLLLVGAFLFGSCYSIGAVALPLLTKHFFGSDNYAKAFPSISFASNLGAAISLSMVGYIYDFFGSYMYAFMIALIMIALAVLLLAITSTFTKQH
ncbi:MFS transporter [Longibaculum muris]|uniref:MFS transporter n=1 Tax=Longibaculum muris TaxID=1796628 RepID=UPI00189E1A7B|nr:MFS transporter [Longibaculum muris]